MSAAHRNGNGVPRNPLDEVQSILAAALRIGDSAARGNDHRGCYELYACAARLVIDTLKGAAAAKQQLQDVLQECAGLSNAKKQARLLRRALDELAAGTVAVPPEGVAEPVEVMRAYIGLAIHIGAPAYNNGDHRGCYEVYACTARMLLQTVEGADEAAALLRQALERCEALDDPNRQAWAMRHAFDAICGAPADPLVAIREYLAMAIRIGAPAYNYGDHRGCYEVYACTARLLLQAVEGADEAKQLLREALERCGTVADVRQQAWIMRGAFDKILGEDTASES